MLIRTPTDGIYLVRLRRQDDDGDYEYMEVVLTAFSTPSSEELPPEIVHGGWEIVFATELTVSGEDEF